MLEARTKSYDHFALHDEELKKAVTVSFNQVSDPDYRKLMAVFGNYALQHRAEKRRVTRIGFFARPQHGKTEACEYMKTSFQGLQRLTPLYFPKGQGEWFDPKIGFIRQYDAAATDHDLTLPAYDNWQYWNDLEKFGADLVEHADKDYADKNFTHIVEIRSDGPAADGKLIRSFKIHTYEEESRSSTYQECIEDMKALGVN